MANSVLLCVLVVLATTAVSDAAVASSSKIAQKLDLCGRKRSDFETCLKDRLQVLLPEIGREGLSEIDLEPLEGFILPEMLVEYQNGNMSAKILVRNAKTMGASDGLEIKAVRADINDPKRFHIEVDFTMPRVFVEGNYKADALLLLPLNTKGYFNISMSDIVATGEVTGEHFTKGGKDYVRITKFSMLPEVGDMTVYASNLFPGSEELSNAALDFANRFWPFIYKELLPFSNEAWDVVVRGMMNRVFLRVPFKEMFPEN